MVDPSLKEKISHLSNDAGDEEFNSIALQLFRIQSKHNIIYRQYLDIIGTDINLISRVDEIPMLPVQLFKNNRITTGEWKEELIFLSSGTSQRSRSKHFIRSAKGYRNNCKKAFERHFGSLTDYHIMALLPSYLENKNSSLIYMVNYFINECAAGGGFYKYDFDKLKSDLENLLDKKKVDKILLFGVSFALLDFCEQFQIENEKLSIMFTGGMKGRQTELSFSQIVHKLKLSFPASQIYSEYGMTEMQSQAYAGENGIFKSSSTMKVLPKEIGDPFTPEELSRTAQLSVIDLANVDTVSFILTEDACRIHPEGFELPGRIQNSDLRGCNLLYLK